MVASVPISSREIIEQGDFGFYRVVRLTLEVGASGDRVDAVWDVQALALPKVAPDTTLDVLVDADEPWGVYPAAGWARTTVE